MQSTNLPWWQQVTALVSLSASGAVTGFTLAPNAAAGVAPPTSTQIHLLAMDQAAQAVAANDTVHRAAEPAPRPPEPVQTAVPARGATHSAGGSGAAPATLGSSDAKLAPDDSALRPAIVNVANYYLRMAANKTPAEMEAIIWQHDSVDGVDHGPSCAAFASLTLELGAQAAGQQSWVTGGGSYPWPLHEWADVRVDPNPASPGITSVKQDAQAHGRWHPLGDGYQPKPGDWVLFDGHVEVVTQYSAGVLHTIGGDSLPNFSVNAHSYSGPLAAQGIDGFVNNGELAPTAGGQTQAAQAQPASSTGQGLADVPGSTGSGPSAGGTAATGSVASGQALSARGLTTPASHAPARHHIHHVRPHGRPAASGSGTGVREPSRSSVPGTGPAEQSATLDASTHWTAAVPGFATATHPLADPPAALTTPYSRHLPDLPATSDPEAATRRAFISEIAPGAIAAQRQYGVPAAVTIAQAIDESGWGQSGLAAQDHNLFGIKGSGPAGRDWQVTEEFENGQYVTRNASFRVYNNVAESINDHGKLLATSGYYRQAMAEQHSPDGFASALTGVYATDPSYGAKLISLMRQYDLYRYDLSSAPSTTGTQTPDKPAQGGASIPGIHEGGTTGRGNGASTGRGNPGPRTPNPSHGSTTPPPVSSPPRTPPPTPTPPRITTPSSGSTTPPPVSTHPRTTPPPRIVTPPETVTMPGLVDAPGSARTSSHTAPQAGTATRSRTAVAPVTQASSRTAAPGAATKHRASTPVAEIPGTATAPAAAKPGLALGGAHLSGPRSAARAPDHTTASTQNSSAAKFSGQTVSAQLIADVVTAAKPSTQTVSAQPMSSPAAPAKPVSAQLTADVVTAAKPSSQTVSAEPMSSPAVRAKPVSAQPTAETLSTAKPSAQTGWPAKPNAPKPRDAAGRTKRSPLIQYHQEMPNSVRIAFVTAARGPLARSEPLYRDVASHTGIRWELLAACDWMQCEARPSHSPVHGEKLGVVNPDGTSYRTKSASLEQCADDLIELAGAVYGIDLLARRFLSVRDLANVFAAFRWGGLLKQHRTSAMEFPYSVAGLTADRIHMRWPNVAEPHAPDKPGARFRRPFGAVPVVLNLHYPVTA